MERSCWHGERVSSHRGFTLVELLVVITIIGILMSLLLPAINSARESARKLQCANSLKQMGMASLQYVAKYNIYPTGGWGWDWVGDADRGYDRRQPGGWAYNLLPFMEQAALHDLGKGGNAAAKTAARTQLVATPLSYMNCPTRRRAVVVRGYARGDYAICSGRIYDQYYGGPGPANTAAGLAAGDSTPPCAKGWHASGSSACWADPGDQTLADGISYERSEVRPASIRGGTSNTLMIGEKYLAVDFYLGDPTSNNQKLGNDNETMYSGFDNDNYRATNLSSPYKQDGPVTALQGEWDGFGSAHLISANFVFCDGSVHAISYGIDKTIWLLLGSRTKMDPTTHAMVPIDMTQVYNY